MMSMTQIPDENELRRLKSAITVLIVDDERSIVRALKKNLELENYKVITAGNAEKGYQLYKENSPQIILTDLMMPGVSGIEYLDLIRSEDQTTEIIIITGYGTMETAIEALRRQASDFLTKPIDFEALNQVMRRALIHLYRKHKITENYSILEKQTHEIASYQKRVEKMVYNVPVAFITYDTEGRILRWNKEAERITGYLQEESIRKPLSELFVNDNQILQNGYPTAQRNQISQFLTKDRQIRYFNRNIGILPDEDGKPAGGIEVFWDVTKQVNNERLLAKRYLQVQIINEIGKTIASDVNINRVMDYVCNKLFQTFFESSQISIFLRNNRNDTFLLKALAGYHIDRVLKKYPLGSRFDNKDSLMYQTVRKKSPLIVNDLQKDSKRESPLLDNAVSVFVFPIQSAGYIAGILSIENIERIEPDESDLFMLEVIAEYLGISLERISLHTKITQQNQLLGKQAKDLKKALRKVETQKQIIERHNDRMVKELEKAGEFQKSLLPEKLPVLDDIRFAVDFHPSSQLGGDFYDVIRFDDNLIAILVADASGHGATSAMLTAMFKMMFEKYASEYDHPSEVFEKLNEDFCKVLQTGEFFTAFYGVYNRTQHKLYYSNAAHPRALLYDYSKKEVEELDTEGFLLGVMNEEIAYETKVITLRGPSRLLIYTDGIIEVLNEKHKMYGYHRMVKQLIRYADKDAQTYIRMMKKDLVKYAKSNIFSDDITLLVMDLQYKS